jgi:hypothetical protein
VGTAAGRTRQARRHATTGLAARCACCAAAAAALLLWPRLWQFGVGLGAAGGGASPGVEGAVSVDCYVVNLLYGLETEMTVCSCAALWCEWWD